MKLRSEFRMNEIPSGPGVYLFYDQFKQLIYVGKARSLRKRISSYFHPSRQRYADPRLRSLIHSIVWFDFRELKSETEALLLESKLIKENKPRYNILLRDDKRFLLLKIDQSVPYPRLELVRIRKDDQAKYFGPFPYAKALRMTANFLAQFFGIRICSPIYPNETDYKHCHADIIRSCSAPCIGKISQEAYREKVKTMLSSLENYQIEPLCNELRHHMQRAAEQQKYEQAARYRDILENIQKIFGTPQRKFVHETSIWHYPGLQGVEALKEGLNLPCLPSRIECFDVSNIMGQFTVASMVCFVNGLPAKEEYRHYRIRSIKGIDDPASIKEVILRRYHRILHENRQFPDLIVIDGGQGQLQQAQQAFNQLKIPQPPILISLAKPMDTIYLAHLPQPVQLPSYHLGLHLLQCLRDEAHRFALKFNRQLRRKQILNSLLDDIPGIGPQRRRKLLAAFGSVTQLRKSSPEEIVQKCSGIGLKLATFICERLRKSPSENKRE